MEMTPTLQLQIIVDVRAGVGTGRTFHGHHYFISLGRLDEQGQGFVASDAQSHCRYCFASSQKQRRVAEGRPHII